MVGNRIRAIDKTIEGHKLVGDRPRSWRGSSRADLSGEVGLQPTRGLAVEQRYMNIADAAHFLGKTESSLRNRIARRTIPFGRDGKSIVFDRFELERYMKGCRLTTDRVAA